MPKNPTGAKRPADVTRNAVLVMKLATGECEETSPDPKAVKRGKAGGPKGGVLSAVKLFYLGRCSIHGRGKLIADRIGRTAHRVSVQMGISSRGVRLRMAEQLSDHPRPK